MTRDVVALRTRLVGTRDRCEAFAADVKGGLPSWRVPMARDRSSGPAALPALTAAGSRCLAGGRVWLCL